MAQQSIRVIHIDTEFGWRGGQQQVIYLHERLIRKNIFSLLICNPNSELEKKCIQLNLPYLSIKMRGEFDFVSAYKISRIVKKDKIDIIQCHSGHAQSIGILSKLFISSVKLIAVRRVDFRIKRNVFSLWKYKTKLVDKIVTVSENIKNVLIGDGIDGKRITTIHSGVDLSKFSNISNDTELQDEFGVESGDIIIGTIAAFVGHKDYANLINAAAIVLEKNSKIRFIAVGDGELLESSKSLANQLNISDRFHFAGYRTNIIQFLNMFDIFVLSSKKEGLGTSVLDAQAIGLPIVATNAGGIPEMIEDGINGILVERKNSIKLAEAILKLADNKDLMSSLGNAAKIGVEKFDVNKTMEANLSLYADLNNKSQ